MRWAIYTLAALALASGLARGDPPAQTCFGWRVDLARRVGVLEGLQHPAPPATDLEELRRELAELRALVLALQTGGVTPRSPLPSTPAPAPVPAPPLPGEVAPWGTMPPVTPLPPARGVIRYALYRP